jgi:iron complex outermembrane receptor protein
MNTIVQRRDAGGGDYFINAGETRQHGIESYLNYTFWKKKKKKGKAWISHTWHDFNYRSFIQLNQDYSGKQLPSVAPQVIASGLDLHFANGFQGAVTYYYSDGIALNDANSEFADAYHLVGLKTGFERSWNHHWKIIISVGVENILDEEYSLGNDINGFGGRYYNAAPGRNYYITVAADWNK